MQLCVCMYVCASACAWCASVFINVGIGNAVVGNITAVMEGLSSHNNTYLQRAPFSVWFYCNLKIMQEFPLINTISCLQQIQSLSVGRIASLWNGFHGGDFCELCLHMYTLTQ